MTPKLKKIIMWIVVVILAFIAYSMFFKKDDDSMTLISGSNGAGNTRTVEETKLLGQQITQALMQIDSLTLEKTIFSNNIFSSLIDRSQPMPVEPVGRKNPFAPLSDTTVNYESKSNPFEGKTTNSNIRNSSTTINISNASTTRTSATTTTTTNTSTSTQRAASSTSSVR